MPDLRGIRGLSYTPIVLISGPNTIIRFSIVELLTLFEVNLSIFRENIWNLRLNSGYVGLMHELRERHCVSICRLLVFRVTLLRNPTTRRGASYLELCVITCADLSSEVVKVDMSSMIVNNEA